MTAEVTLAPSAKGTVATLVCRASLLEIGALVVWTAAFVGVLAHDGRDTWPPLWMAGLYHVVGLCAGFWPGSDRVREWIETAIV
jgi:hypothetical protein